jgi:hypothetical protein
MSNRLCPTVLRKASVWGRLLGSVMLWMWGSESEKL